MTDTAVVHLAKIISDARFPVPCMNKGACESLAAHIVAHLDVIDPAGKTTSRLLNFMAPNDTSIRDL